MFGLGAGSYKVCLKTKTVSRTLTEKKVVVMVVEGGGISLCAL